MLDVEPPDHAVHTWRDFFIHIATIVVGLLIAIGLEQTVEYVHRRHELSEVREALRVEHATNRRELAAYVPEFRRFNQALEGNLADLIYLQKHPGTPMSRLPAKMNWNGVSITIRESAWMAAKQSNATQMMSDEERRRYEDFYGWLETTAQRAQSSFAAVHAARYYTVRDFDPSHLSPQ